MGDSKTILRSVFAVTSSASFARTYIAIAIFAVIRHFVNYIRTLLRLFGSKVTARTSPGLFFTSPGLVRTSPRLVASILALAKSDT